MSNAEAVPLLLPHHFPPAIARSTQPPRPRPLAGSVQLQPHLQVQLDLYFPRDASYLAQHDQLLV
jgi:hypothetical protein